MIDIKFDSREFGRVAAIVVDDYLFMTGRILGLNAATRATRARLVAQAAVRLRDELVYTLDFKKARKHEERKRALIDTTLQEVVRRLEPLLRDPAESGSVEAIEIWSKRVTRWRLALDFEHPSSAGGWMPMPACPDSAGPPGGELSGFGGLA